MHPLCLDALLGDTAPVVPSTTLPWTPDVQEVTKTDMKILGKSIIPIASLFGKAVNGFQEVILSV